MNFTQVRERSLQEWLESERATLIALSKEIKCQKKTVSKCKSALESLKKEVQTLETKWQKSKEKLRKVQSEIRIKRRRIRRYKKLLEKFKGRKDEIRKQVEEAEQNIQKSKEKSEDLQLALKEFQFQFDEIGVAVSQDVDKRIELNRELEIHNANLSRLQIEETEIETDDVEELCKEDPLFLIESNYPFFQDERQCTVEDIGNIENPKRCKEAMNSFVNILYENVHRFKHVPMGPLYQCVVVKNKKWAPLVEYVLRPYIFHFLVDNIVDSLVMDELLEEHFPGYEQGITTAQGAIVPSYYVFPFKNQHVIDSRITAMSGLELENMLETIHFNDDNWGNFLSHVISIEKTIFMDNENIAFLVLSHIKNSPWHCKRAYTLDGFVVYPFPDFRTKKIMIFERSMYLQCLPSYKVGEARGKIWRTTRNIDRLTKEISAKRGSQLKIAKEIDEIRHKIDVASSYGLLCVAMKKEIIALLNEPMSCSTEKRELKYLKNKTKKLRKTFMQYDSEFNTKGSELLELNKKLETDCVTLDQLEEELERREETFFAMRNTIWRLQDEADKLECCNCDDCIMEV